MRLPDSGLGIDFGTTYSSMSWFDPKANQSSIIHNLDGESKTPSVVYYGPDGTSAGTAALNGFTDAVSLADGHDKDAASRYIRSIKRNLLRPPVIALPGGRTVRPRDVVALILGKLKRDAEEGHFHEKVPRATITVPAAFDEEQRAVIEAGAKLAGFEKVEILEEPVAAAMAFACEGQKVGKSILVYDLGGGTFDLAVLTRTADEPFAVALPPAGDPECGGDDFDKALYDYCNQQYGIGGNGEVDVPFLLECRVAKEKLSGSSKTVLQRLIDGRPRPLALTKECFEGLIRERVSKTIRKTAAMLEQAKSAGCEVDTLVLVGGSARVPLVNQELNAILARSGGKAALLKYSNQDVAVALGASCAREPRPVPKVSLEDLERRYRDAQKPIEQLTQRGELICAEVKSGMKDTLREVEDAARLFIMNYPDRVPGWIEEFTPETPISYMISFKINEYIEHIKLKMKQEAATWGKETLTPLISRSVQNTFKDLDERTRAYDAQLSEIRLNLIFDVNAEEEEPSAVSRVGSIVYGIITQDWLTEGLLRTLAMQVVAGILAIVSMFTLVGLPLPALFIAATVAASAGFGWILISKTIKSKVKEGCQNALRDSKQQTDMISRVKTEVAKELNKITKQVQNAFHEDIAALKGEVEKARVRGTPPSIRSSSSPRDH